MHRGLCTRRPGNGSLTNYAAAMGCNCGKTAMTSSTVVKFRVTSGSGTAQTFDTRAEAETYRNQIGGGVITTVAVAT